MGCKHILVLDENYDYICIKCFDRVYDRSVHDFILRDDPLPRDDIYVMHVLYQELLNRYPGLSDMYSTIILNEVYDDYISKHVNLNYDDIFDSKRVKKLTKN